MAGTGGIFNADGGFAAEEVEIAPLVGLQHVVEEEAAVAPREVTILAMAGTGGIFGADRRFPAEEVEVAALVGLEPGVHAGGADAHRAGGVSRPPGPAAHGPAAHHL